MTIYLLAYWPPCAPGFKVEAWSDDCTAIEQEAAQRNDAVRKRVGKDYRADMDGRFGVMPVSREL